MEDKIENIMALLGELKFFDKMAARHKAAGISNFSFEQYHDKKEHLLRELMIEILNAGLDNFQTSRLIYSLLNKYHKSASMNGKEVTVELEEMLHELVPA
ncbi:MAG: hypothetical protein AAB316_03060 [Bacteroidota bacterium]